MPKLANIVFLYQTGVKLVTCGNKIYKDVGTETCVIQAAVTEFCFRSGEVLSVFGVKPNIALFNFYDFFFSFE